MRTTAAWLLAGALLGATPAAAQGGIITSGTATFEWDGFGFGYPGSANFTTDGFTDHVYETWWYYRLGGGTFEARLPDPDTESYVGNTATLTWTDFDGTGLDATLVTTITSSSPSDATVTHLLTISNPGAAPQSITIFGYGDYDVDDTSTGDSAVSMGPTQIAVTDTTLVIFAGPGSLQHQVAPFPDLLDALDDTAITDLDGTGLPFGPDDWTGAYQWSAVISGGGSASFTIITSTAPVPLCGNGVVEIGETCDDGFTDACGTCNATCDGPGTGSTCGDGIVCLETEACDDGFNDACGTCNETCDTAGTGSTCGDGVVCPETETCDDGYADACGTCNETCDGPGSGSTCGDGMLCAETEACDDGFTDACGTCNETCDGAGGGSTCGDSMVCAETEACDDGNTADGDGCSSACALEMLPDAGPMEEEDAGMVVDHDAGTGGDAGDRPDAGGQRDAGVPGIDAGGGPASRSGCGCGVPADDRSPLPLLASLLVLGVARLRRRR